jgi:hypothetical protein
MTQHIVMVALGPTIHDFRDAAKVVDGQAKPDHDDKSRSRA